jgi:hypothetical protein
MSRVTHCLPFADGVCSDNLTGRGGDAIMLCGGKASPTCDRTLATEHVMMVGAWPCKLLSEVHVSGRWVTNLVSLEMGKEGVATG